MYVLPQINKDRNYLFLSGLNRGKKKKAVLKSQITQKTVTDLTFKHSRWWLLNVSF